MNSKAQVVNLGFIVSTILLTLVIVAVILAIARWVPAVRDSANDARLNDKAHDLSQLLLDDPGNPVDWTVAPERIGLGLYNSYAGEVVRGSLDLTKVISLETSPWTYGKTKSRLNLTNDTDFRLLVLNASNGAALADHYAAIPKGATRTIALERRMLANGTKVNVTLWVW